MRCERQKRVEIGRMTSFERFVSERENLELNSLIYFEPVKRFENRSDMMKFWSTSDGTGSRIENKLKTVSLISCRSIHQYTSSTTQRGTSIYIKYNTTRITI